MVVDHGNEERVDGEARRERTQGLRSTGDKNKRSPLAGAENDFVGSDPSNIFSKIAATFCTFRAYCNGRTPGRWDTDRPTINPPMTAAWRRRCDNRRKRKPDSAEWGQKLGSVRRVSHWPHRVSQFRWLGRACVTPARAVYDPAATLRPERARAPSNSDICIRGVVTIRFWEGAPLPDGRLSLACRGEGNMTPARFQTARFLFFPNDKTIFLDTYNM